jgi:hypothetical protein
MIGTIDITERKKQKLQTEKLYRALIEKAITIRWLFLMAGVSSGISHHLLKCTGL